MHTQTSIQPELLIWARKRAKLATATLEKRFPELTKWEAGVKAPTLSQLEDFAKAVKVPIGYLFLRQPPQERLPLPDFRTLAHRDLNQPSPDLLETINICQARQDWFRDYAQVEALDPIDFIGKYSLDDQPEAVAKVMRQTLKIDLDERKKLKDWESALRELRKKVEDAGILLMISGIVGSNTKRKLNVEEFRGFTLVDNLAPLIFINGADSKSAQMFTIAHELAHLWLGQSGISQPIIGKPNSQKVETWCDAVAAEFLVPLSLIKKEFNKKAEIPKELQRLARVYKVSTLVILRRLFDAKFISKKTLWSEYQKEIKQIASYKANKSDGGNFYSTLNVRVGERFVKALIPSTLEGQTLFRDAFRLLGISDSDIFHKLARKFKIAT